MKVIFYKSRYGTIIDKIISRWTNGIYSHCEFYFESLGICFTADIKKNKCRFKGAFINDHWDVVDVPDVDEKEIFLFCKKIDGAFYDWKGLLFNFLLSENIHSKKKYFCSELCVLGLQKGGHKGLSNIIAHKTSPNQLYRLIG